MLRVFNATASDYSTNGEVVLMPTKARVINADNGDFYLNLTCGVEYNKFLAANNIIVAPTPQGAQPFRIRNIEKKGNRITIKAYHVFYDSENYLIKDSYAFNMNCNAALDHFNNATDTLSPFTTRSNIATLNSFRCVRKSLCEAINTVVERWGGHLYRDGFNISVMSEIGTDNGINIEYRKNLQEMTATYNWDNVCTKLLPTGTNGIMLDEGFLYSEIQYDIPYTKTVAFTQNISEEDYKNSNGETDVTAYEAALKEDLKNQATKYLATYSYPVINYTLKADPEKVTDIGDTILVKDERIGVTVKTQVIKYEYDAITEKYVTLEFGNFTNTLNDLLTSVSSSTSATVDNAIVTLSSTLSSALSEAQERIWGALGSSYCIYEGDKILIVDQLPKSAAVNVIMLNSAGISFSNTGINGNFTLAITIDGTFNAQAVNVINMTADLIKGGTLKLGSTLNESGKVEVYDEANTLICTIDKQGIIMNATNGGYVVLNQNIGLAAFDGAGNPVYWVNGDEFHMNKAVVENEITLCSKLRFLPITLEENGQVVSDGIGLVSTYDGN